MANSSLVKDDLVLASNVAAMAMQLSGGGYEIMYDEFLEAREKVERMIAAFEEKREVLSEQITLVHALCRDSQSPTRHRH